MAAVSVLFFASTRPLNELIALRACGGQYRMSPGRSAPGHGAVLCRPTQALQLIDADGSRGVAD